jgi:phosphoribosyl 1,2-cyclic phosphodiesterase
MRIRFWGVRGSIAAPGPETNRYGGNTPCTSVRLGDDHLLVIDMGTGLMQLGNHLMQDHVFSSGEGRATVLLSHSHWDHIQGFPFFPPIFVPGNQFHIHGNAKSSSMLEGILEGQMNPHFSPIHTIRNLGAGIEFSAVTPGEPFKVRTAEVRTVANPHGATTALAFRVEEQGRSLVYASDVGYPEAGPSAEALELYRGADVLIHDCTYSPEDRAPRQSRGLSSYLDAAAVAVHAGARRLVMFHYDQDYADDKVDRMFTACRAELDRQGGAGVELIAAAEGLELEV